MKTYELVPNEFGNSLKMIDANQVEWWIPLDPANSDYAEYLRYTAWVEAGNSPEDFWVAEGDTAETLDG